MKRAKYISFIFILFCLLAVSCKQNPQFKVEGVIDGAAGQTVYLERRGISDIMIIDSSKIADNGSFSIKAAAPEYPDLYLLRLGGQSINLAVDSTETIRVEASEKNFASDYKIEGSESSLRIKEVLTIYTDLNKKVTELKNQFQGNSISDDDYLKDVQAVITEYKDKIKKLIISNVKSQAAYFALFQKIDGVLIFNPYDKADSKMYAAVATAWNIYYKDSPRTIHLKNFTLSSIKERRMAENQANLLEGVQQIDKADFYNIELPDINNKTVSLTSLKGKVVLLDFTVYQAEYSPVHNMAINKVYEKYKNNLEVYQVSFDSDAHFWHNASKNLPWICVRDPHSVTSDLIYKYNLQQLPTAYLLNKNGELVKRLSADDNVEAEIRKLL